MNELFTSGSAGGAGWETAGPTRLPKCDVIFARALSFMTRCYPDLVLDRGRVVKEDGAGRTAVRVEESHR
jgi:hypothetical protein